MYRLLISGWLLLGFLYPQEQSADGATNSVCGNVLDESGAPAALTRVTAIYMGGHSGMEPIGRTDRDGHYCITGIQAGEYAMSASDQEKGYPDMSTLFYSGDIPGPRVWITQGGQKARLNWQIPYKAGFLRVNLRDSSNGKLIEAMFTELYVGSSDSSRYNHGSEGSDQVLLIPPNENVHLKVTASGYESWPEGEAQGRLVNLLPGQHETLAVSLRPKTP